MNNFDSNLLTNGPRGMYEMKELCQLPPKISLPSSMYKMKSFYEQDVKNEDVQALEERQERILRQLQELKLQLQRIRSEVSVQTPLLQKSITSEKNFPGEKVEDRQNIVISANPSFPPLSLKAAIHFLKNDRTVGFRYHLHSSVKNVPEKSSSFLGTESDDAMSKYDFFITLIWKNNKDDIDPVMMIDPLTQTEIKGEVNILRHLSSWLSLPGDKPEPYAATEVDSVLDLVHGSLLHGSSKEKQASLRSLNSRLGKSKWLTGSDLSIGDLAAWSAIRQLDLTSSVPANVKKWIEAMKSVNEV